MRMGVSRCAIGVVVIFICAALSACDRGNDGSGSLTQEENDIRVGRPVIRCGVPLVGDEVIDALDDVVSSTRLLRAVGAASSSGDSSAARSGVRQIPVAIHVIASGPTADEGNVSDAALANQIAVLNGAYANAPSFAGGTYVFSVVSISRTIDPLGASMSIGSQLEADVKGPLHVGGAETLNLYLSNPTDGTLGWATFPWDYPNNPLIDGVVISFETLPGGAFAPYNEGDTLVHEVGHWLGLLHTFQGGCFSSGDLIGDTPSELNPSFGCQEGRNSCLATAGPDPIHNFMDYSDDFCLFEFSPEQSERIDVLGSVYRGL